MLTLSTFFSLLPVDAGRKLNAHKTFKKLPGPLLNVLCTFKLRSVSAGYSEFKGKLGRTYP